MRVPLRGRCPALPCPPRPLLIGTTSVRESETVLEAIRRYTDPRYDHRLESVQMLNAKPDKVRPPQAAISRGEIPLKVLYPY